MATVVDGVFVTLPAALDVRTVFDGGWTFVHVWLGTVSGGTHELAVYALFINDGEQMEKNCLLKTISHATGLACSLDGSLLGYKYLGS